MMPAGADGKPKCLYRAYMLAFRANHRKPGEFALRHAIQTVAEFFKAISIADGDLGA